MPNNARKKYIKEQIKRQAEIKEKRKKLTTIKILKNTPLIKK